jgi:hypothetical protein
MGVWGVLQKHDVWFKKLPGPVRVAPLLIMGFWASNAPPIFKSPQSFLKEIVSDVEHKRGRDVKLLDEF